MDVRYLRFPCRIAWVVRVRRVYRPSRYRRQRSGIITAAGGERGKCLGVSGPVETPTTKLTSPLTAIFYAATELRWCRHFDGLKTVAPEVIVPFSSFVRQRRDNLPALTPSPPWLLADVRNGIKKQQQ